MPSDSARLDSTLRVSAVQRADKLNSDIVYVMDLCVRITSVRAAPAIVLSLAGIYAVLSFTVVVCSLAVIVPARRALRVEPAVALRAE